MVGAVLTIAGYSINDTIVVYDRIREGLASGRKGSIEQIMNESVNQTLSRTILTSTVTLIPILVSVLFWWRGAAGFLARDHHWCCRRDVFLQSSSPRRSSFGGPGRGAEARAVCGGK